MLGGWCLYVCRPTCNVRQCRCAVGSDERNRDDKVCYNSSTDKKNWRDRIHKAMDVGVNPAYVGLMELYLHQNPQDVVLVWGYPMSQTFYDTEAAANMLSYMLNAGCGISRPMMHHHVEHCGFRVTAESMRWMEGGRYCNHTQTPEELSSPTTFDRRTTFMYAVMLEDVTEPGVLNDLMDQPATNNSFRRRYPSHRSMRLWVSGFAAHLPSQYDIPPADDRVDQACRNQHKDGHRRAWRLPGGQTHGIPVIRHVLWIGSGRLAERPAPRPRSPPANRHLPPAFQPDRRTDSDRPSPSHRPPPGFPPLQRSERPAPSSSVGRSGERPAPPGSISPSSNVPPHGFVLTQRSEREGSDRRPQPSGGPTGQRSERPPSSPVLPSSRSSEERRRGGRREHRGTSVASDVLSLEASDVDRSRSPSIERSPVAGALRRPSPSRRRRSPAAKVYRRSESTSDERRAPSSRRGRSPTLNRGGHRQCTERRSPSVRRRRTPAAQSEDERRREPALEWTTSAQFSDDEDIAAAGPSVPRTFPVCGRGRGRFIQPPHPSAPGRVPSMTEPQVPAPAVGTDVVGGVVVATRSQPAAPGTDVYQRTEASLSSARLLRWNVDPNAAPTVPPTKSTGRVQFTLTTAGVTSRPGTLLPTDIGIIADGEETDLNSAVAALLVQSQMDERELYNTKRQLDEAKAELKSTKEKMYQALHEASAATSHMIFNERQEKARIYRELASYLLEERAAADRWGEFDSPYVTADPSAGAHHSGSWPYSVDMECKSKCHLAILDTLCQASEYCQSNRMDQVARMFPVLAQRVADAVVSTA